MPRGDLEREYENWGQLLHKLQAQYETSLDQACQQIEMEFKERMDSWQKTQ